VTQPIPQLPDAQPNEGGPAEQCPPRPRLQLLLSANVRYGDAYGTALVQYLINDLTHLLAMSGGQLGA
jgi:hypothetical protein